MGDQLPALQIVIPLLSAPLCVALRNRTAVRLFATIVCWLTFAVSVLLLRRVLDQQVVSYALGGWLAPWGIEYRVDALGAFVLTFVSAIGAIVASYAPRSLDAEVAPERQSMFYSAYLLCLTGLLGIAITGDLFNVFVFLEISSLSSYALISLGKDRRALTASFQYLIMGTIGATFILIAIGLLYIMTGTLNMADMAQRIPSVTGTRTVLAASGFLVVGVGIKMAMFPLHVWLPNAYTYAPSVVSAFLAATATKVSIYIMLRFGFTVLGSTYLFERLQIDVILLPAALVGAFFASTVAIFQRDVKRLLAYSSVAQIGYMVLGIGFGSLTGLTGTVVHMFNHALMKGALFMAMGCFALRVGGVSIDDLRGLGREMPLTVFAWVVGGLGLIGVPLTAGFVSKWYLVNGALERDLWPVAAAVLLSSLLALVYVWRVVETFYFKRPITDRPRASEAPLSMLSTTWLMVSAVVLFGTWAVWSSGVARQAAEALLGSAS